MLTSFSDFFGPLDKSTCVYFLIVSVIFFISMIILLFNELYFVFTNFNKLNFRLISGGILTTNVAATGAHTVLIDGIILSLGIPSTVLTPGTGIYGSIDSKTNRSLFGSGNVAIYGIGPLEYINLVYNNDHFEDIKLISNHALNLKEPYKSLPNALNNLSNIVNTKQDNLLFTSPLLKDASNNITIDLSSYVLKTNFDLSFNDLQNETKIIYYLHRHY